MQENHVALFTDLFVYMLMWNKTYAKKQPPLAEVKGKIRVLLDEQEETVKRDGLSEENYNQSRFAVLAWIDELIMNSKWEQRNEWREHLLQNEFYKTTNAGEEFYERLTRLHPEQSAVREIYYLCLCLDFRGRYCWEEDEPTLKSLKHQHLLLLPDSLKLEDVGRKPLMFEAYDDQVLEYKPPKEESGLSLTKKLILGIAPPAVAALLFVVFTYVLNGAGGTVMSQLAGG